MECILYHNGHKPGKNTQKVDKQKFVFRKIGCSHELKEILGEQIRRYVFGEFVKTCRELDISPERQSEETEMEEDDEEDEDELIDIYARRRDSSSTQSVLRIFVHSVSCHIVFSIFFCMVYFPNLLETSLCHQIFAF